MSERREIEEDASQLAIPEIPFADLLSEIGDPVSVIATDFRILWANKLILEGLGLSLEQVEGKLCHEVYQRRERVCPDCPVSGVFKSEKARVTEKRFESPDGSSVWREVRAYPVRDKNGTITSAIRIGFDITDRKLRGDRRTRHVEALEKTLKEITEGRFEESGAREGEELQARLTNRELEVLALVAEGLTNTQISRILCISPHTVKSHVVHLFNKLGVKDRTEAAVKAARLQLI